MLREAELCPGARSWELEPAWVVCRRPEQGSKKVGASEVSGIRPGSGARWASGQVGARSPPERVTLQA